MTNPESGKVIYDDKKEFLAHRMPGDKLRCSECGESYDSMYAFYDDARTGKQICADCVYEHYDNKDTGVYPIETGLGRISTDMLLFDDWADFFNLEKGKKWEIVEHYGKLHMQENGTYYSIIRYKLIATEQMVKDFSEVKQ